MKQNKISGVVRRVTDAGDPSAQARVFLGQLARWKKFLSASLVRPLSALPTIDGGHAERGKAV